jgi:hypothetical protein
LKLALPKSFVVMKLLNRTYSAPLKALLACFAFITGWAASGRFTLGAELAKRCLRHNDLKLAARRGAWYLRRGWANIDVLPDDYFDPTEDLSDDQLNVMERFIIARSSKLLPVTAATDRAFISARRLDNNSNPTARATNIAALKGACDALLSYSDMPLPVTLKPEKPRKGDFPIADAKQTLADFIDLFPQGEMPWFLVSGTFLGLVREKGFLAHDYDIDLGVFEADVDIPTILKKISSSNVFVLKKYDYHQSSLFRPDTVSTNPEIPYIIKIVHVSGIHIDLFIHYRDTRTDPAIYWHGSSLHRWENSAFGLSSYAFYDHDVLGPTDADTYLTENYGDWQTPKTEFNCTTDTPNLALVPHPIAVVIFLKRYVMAKSGDTGDAQKLQNELMHNGFLKMDAEENLSFSGDLFAQ